MPKVQSISSNFQFYLIFIQNHIIKFPIFQFTQLQQESESHQSIQKLKIQLKDISQKKQKLDQNSMIQEIIFAFYLALLTLVLIFGGINYYKLRDKHQTNPDIIVFLLPFILNFILAKYIFVNINPFFSTFLPCIIIYFLGKRFKNVRIIGLTGGIATGKSTLVKQIRKNLPKLHIIDCDQITTNLRKKQKAGYKVILSLLGQKSQQFIDPATNQIDREKLSKHAFENASFRKKLTVKMGQLILWEIIKDIFKSMFSKRNLILIDASILYESKILPFILFPIIVVGCSQQMQIQRLKKRNNYEREDALKRIKSQMPLSIKQKKADIYIRNQGSEEDLFKNTLEKLNKYLQKK